MGYYSEYLDRGLASVEDLSAERKQLLGQISALRGRNVLVYAADLSGTKTQAPVSLGFDDLLPINDQVANLDGDALDLILQTPGGSGEVAEDIVLTLRQKYEDLAVIIPSWAKSAGTIMAMAGDEILMEPSSALGPIDAQLMSQGKVFSAHAFLEGFDRIKQEVTDTGVLNKAYIPILQAISPGELQNARNAQDFAKVLVQDWLVKYKFKHWETHASSGQPVTEEEKRNRAEAIAARLCDHGAWLTHGGSIKLADLTRLGLKVTDYSQRADLAEAIRRYHTLLQMTFQQTTIYKVIETPSSQILRFIRPVAGPGKANPGVAKAKAVLDFRCPKCGHNTRIQANMGSPAALDPGNTPFPADNRFVCPSCKTEADLTPLREKIEAQVGRPVVT